MRKERLTRWFLEPRDAHTNETAVMDLVNGCGATEDRIHYGKKDNKGVAHNVVEVNHMFISRIEKNAEKFKLLFRVFTQAEGENFMKLWPFGCQKKLCQTAEVKRLKQKLATIKNSATAQV